MHRKTQSTKDAQILKILRLASTLSFIASLVFIVLLMLSKIPNIKLWYASYQTYLSNAETAVMNMDNKMTILVVVLFLFLFKSAFPIYLYPLSALCTVASAVFPPYFSIPINLLGLTLLYSFKYFWGKKVGASGVQSILQKSRSVQYLVERDGKGNPWLLSLFRLIPGLPINQVSKLYGAMGFEYRKYLLLSLLGYAPKLIAYTFIGHNVFDPLSAAFLLPFILMFVFISVSMLALSRIYKIQIKRRRQHDRDKKNSGSA